MDIRIETNVHVTNPKYPERAKTYPEIFVAHDSQLQAQLLKDAKFSWDSARKRWWTDSVRKASFLIAYSRDDTVRSRLAPTADLRGLSRSIGVIADLPVPAGLEYLPYQKAGIVYANNFDSCLIADEMGLGKTITAIGVINCDTTIKRVLVVCPAGLKNNWENELKKWLVRPMTVGIASSKKFPGCDVTIINYDILVNYAATWPKVQYDLLILDEAHYCKTSSSQRSKMVKTIKARRKLLLTGTPIGNRPREIYPLLNMMNPKVFGDWQHFAFRYCAAFNQNIGGRNIFNTEGASNLDELQDVARVSGMVRRLKQDVLSELPPKIRQIIELPPSKLVEQENEQLQLALTGMGLDPKAPDFLDRVENLFGTNQAAFTDIARIRHDTGLAKVPYVVSHIKNALDQSDGGKIILFAHHADVIAALREQFQDISVGITGKTPVEQRQALVDSFQNNPGIRLMIGNIQAAGVGFTMTASSHVVFAESDWVPGNLTQAEDRAHRIGQLNSVLVQHLVLSGSIDSMILNAVIRKQGIADEALDRPRGTPTPPDAFIKGESPKLQDNRPPISQEQIQLILMGLTALSQMEKGFNEVDEENGKDLATRPILSQKQAMEGKRLCIKYRRKLPEELVNKIIGSTGKGWVG